MEGDGLTARWQTFLKATIFSHSWRLLWNIRRGHKIHILDQDRYYWSSVGEDYYLHVYKRLIENIHLEPILVSWGLDYTIKSWYRRLNHFSMALLNLLCWSKWVYSWANVKYPGQVQTNRWKKNDYKQLETQSGQASILRKIRSKLILFRSTLQIFWKETFYVSHIHWMCAVYVKGDWPKM